MSSARPAPGRVCPICGDPVQEQFKPFCSKRCADVDLHRWLSGSYSVPAAEAETDEDDYSLADLEGGAAGRPSPPDGSGPH